MDAILADRHLDGIGDLQFVDFGDDSLNPYPALPLQRVEAECSDSLRTQVRQQVPRKPGVYGMLDLLGRLIYVGKSKALRNRLLSYFLPGNEEDKSGRIIQSTRQIVWEVQPNEFAALVREQFLIRKFQPRFNVQGMPRRQQQVFVCLGRTPAEQLYVSRKLDASAITVLGPLSGASRASRAVEVLNRIFQLRDCSTRQSCSFADQLRLFEIELRPGCIRLEIGSCLGPCVAACSRTQYDQQVQRAREFLAGQDVTAIEILNQQMKQVSEQLHFEQAMRIRDDLRAVQWLSHRAADVAIARESYSFIYPIAECPSDYAKTETGHKPSNVTNSIWYLIRHGKIEGAMAAPQTKPQWQAASKTIRTWWTKPDSCPVSISSRPETVALVASWFRKHRSELKRIIRPDSAGRLPSSARRQIPR